MFICKNCLEKDYQKNIGVGIISFGSCEICSITKECFDIHHSQLIRKTDKIKKN